MRAASARIRALMVKELLATLKDRKSRAVLIGIPLVQLIIFPYAATFEVWNVDTVVFNADAGTFGRELVARFTGARAFEVAPLLTNDADLGARIRRGEADLAIRIGEEFSAAIKSGQPAPVQLIVDGRNSNTALIVLGYARSIVEAFEVEISEDMRTAPVSRALYNPNLLSRWFIVPGLVGVLTLIVTMAVTAFSLAREKEVGTFQQLLITPLRPWEILVGKTLPALLIGMAEGGIFVAAAVLGYGVPFRGSLALLFLSLAVFLLSVIGVGLMVSTLSRTQQQALFGGFLFIVPAIILSGFATPIFAMPTWVQWLTYVNPLRYFLVIVRGEFLKDLPLEVVLQQLWPMASIAAITLFAAQALFRRRLT